MQFPFRQFLQSPDEIVVEAVDFVEAIVLTARRNTLVISPYCVISLVKIFIFIEWLYSTPKDLCYVINIYIYIRLVSVRRQVPWPLFVVVNQNLV